ncbi:UDP-glucose 4-epimerase GalE [Agaricicola taiwanensis]|uniref:UDP-glucose 4-epimerase n=1 Tax=Agaricicola taiwanensis TaxID=591372 RepID=A0A8J2YNN5_9RHOB|nr:UDP-glucose 4-epimerase GalE [Agaricicola taiwanensis]GGE55767.1 UDP-glucose 4-epimerase GalE [Agaricicola taiwanensis]
MAILVTGGAGYIGSHMVLALKDRGEDVVVLDDFSTGFPWAVADGVPVVEGDVADRELVARLIADHGVTEIAHFAAKIVVPESVENPLLYYHANTAKTRDLIETAVKTGVKHFIFSSTAAVYGNPLTNPVGEDAVPAPMSPYGTSKLMSEWVLRDAAAAHGFTYAVLRYFNVAGADPQGRSGQSTPNATHLIKVACQTALGQRPKMDVFGTDFPTPDGTCVRDYIHVTDLAEAHVVALQHLRQGGGSITANCGYGRGFSVLEVIEAVKRASGIDFRADLGPRRAGDPAMIVAKADFIRQQLGWVPGHDDLDGIVTQALAWEKRLGAAHEQDRVSS